LTYSSLQFLNSDFSPSWESDRERISIINISSVGNHLLGDL
jgi:hypothetical protein